jgi:serine phosphatase RsbU (regulator of sigma subunit)
MVLLFKLLGIGTKPDFSVQMKRLYHQVNGLNIFYTFVALSMCVMSFTILTGATGTFILGIVQAIATMFYFSNILLAKFNRIGLAKKLTINTFEWHLFLVVVLTNAWNSPVLLVVMLYPILAVLTEESIGFHVSVSLTQVILCLGFRFLDPELMNKVIVFDSISPNIAEILKILAFIYFPVMAGVLIKIIYSENVWARKKEKTMLEKLEDLIHEISNANNEIRLQLLMAQRIQESIFPKSFPDTSAVHFESLYLPLDEIGGDFYDAFMIGDKKLGVLIGDVSGHGVPAALITMMMKVAFVNNAQEHLTAARAITNINRDLFAIFEKLDQYVTLFYGIIDLDSMEIEWVNAGHNDILILNSQGNITKLESQNTIVGKIHDFDFISTETALKPRDKLILYTDGIVEARNSANQFFTSERFLDLLGSYRSSGSREMAAKILKDVQDFSGSKRLSDDVSLVIADILTVVKREDYKTRLDNAQAAHQNGQYDDSIRTLLEIYGKSDQDADNSLVSYLLGFNYYKLHDLEKSALYFKEALDLNPNNRKIEIILNTINKKIRFDKPPSRDFSDITEEINV